MALLSTRRSPVARLLHVALGLALALPLWAGRTPLRYDLTELSLEELLEVEVSLASRHPQRLAETPAAVAVLAGEDLRRSGVRSLPEALRLVPGLQVARVDANKWVVTSRGFAGLFANKLLVLIDGRSVYTPMFSGVFWESQDVFLADVERIEVIRGPGGALWGANAVNGIINVVTRGAASTQGGRVEVGGGTEERAFGSARYGGRLGEGGHYRVYGKWFARDRSAPSGPLAVRDDWHMGRGGGRLELELTGADDLTLQADVNAGQVGQGLTYVRRPAAPFYETRYFDAEVNGGNVLARWSHRSRGGGALTVQAYYDRFERREEPIRGLIQNLDLDLQRRRSWEAGHQLVWGGGYRRTFDHYDGSFTMRLVPESRTVHLWSGFLHGELAVRPERLHLSGGARLEHNSFTGFEWQPSARVWWSPRAGHALWSSVSRAVRTPSRADHGIRAVVRVVADSLLLVLRGDPSFVPEHMLALDAGYRGQLSPGVAVDLAVFANRYGDLQTNELDFSAVDPAAHPPEIYARVANEAEALSAGLEAGADWQVRDGWRARASYTYYHLDLDLAAGSLDATTQGYESESPAHQLGLRLQGDLPRGVEVDVVGRLVSPIDSHGVGTYATADAHLGVPLATGCRLYVVGQNLVQQEHREIDSNSSGTVHAAVQRGFYAALEWSF
ncbi:MAG: TonB-dependent receptor [Gemmatimonadota bacterium]